MPLTMLLPLSLALIKPARNEIRFLNQGCAFIIISNILKQKGSHFSPFIFSDRNPPSLHDPAPNEPKIGHVRIVSRELTNDTNKIIGNLRLRMSFLKK